MNITATPLESDVHSIPTSFLTLGGIWDLRWVCHHPYPYSQHENSPEYEKSSAHCVDKSRPDHEVSPRNMAHGTNRTIKQSSALAICASPLPALGRGEKRSHTIAINTDRNANPHKINTTMGFMSVLLRRNVVFDPVCDL